MAFVSKKMQTRATGEGQIRNGNFNKWKFRLVLALAGEFSLLLRETIEQKGETSKSEKEINKINAIGRRERESSEQAHNMKWDMIASWDRGRREFNEACAGLKLSCALPRRSVIADLFREVNEFSGLGWLLSGTYKAVEMSSYVLIVLGF